MRESAKLWRDNEKEHNRYVQEASDGDNVGMREGVKRGVADEMEEIACPAAERVSHALLRSRLDNYKFET